MQKNISAKIEIAERKENEMYRANCKGLQINYDSKRNILSTFFPDVAEVIIIVSDKTRVKCLPESGTISCEYTKGTKKIGEIIENIGVQTENGSFRNNVHINGYVERGEYGRLELHAETIMFGIVAACPFKRSCRNMEWGQAATPVPDIPTEVTPVAEEKELGKML